MSRRKDLRDTVEPGKRTFQRYVHVLYRTWPVVLYGTWSWVLGLPPVTVEGKDSFLKARSYVKSFVNTKPHFNWNDVPISTIRDKWVILW